MENLDNIVLSDRKTFGMGFGEGIIAGFDPVGAVLTYFTNIHSFGGGYVSKEINTKEFESINHPNKYYSGKALGAAISLPINVATSGVMQLLFGIGDVSLIAADMSEKKPYHFRGNSAHYNMMDYFRQVTGF